MNQETRQEIYSLIILFIIMLIFVNVYTSEPTIIKETDIIYKTQIEYVNVTIPCEECVCEESKIIIKEETNPNCNPDIVLPKWCNGYKCDNGYYCKMDRNSLISECIIDPCMEE